MSTGSGQADPSAKRDVRYYIAARAAVVAGVFLLVVCALLLYDHSLRRAVDPHEAEWYKSLKAALAAEPENEALREQIRQLDLDLRREYFQRRMFTAVGTWMLVGGMVFFLIAARSAATLRRKMPEPRPEAAPVDRETQWTRTARWTVGGLAVLLLAVALGLDSAARSELPESAKELAALLEQAAEPSPDLHPTDDPSEALHSTDVPPLPSPQETQAMWPRFRGPDGSGISAYDNVPQSWDEASGENILWKTPVPLPGMNSPVVWGNRVFLSGATVEQREVYCFDTVSGELLWRKPAPANPQVAEIKDLNYTGYAAPTMATDGRFVVAIFVDGELVAYDFDGRQVWHKSLGIPSNHYGHASSLAVYRDLVIVQLDQGTRQEPWSAIAAFDTATGEMVWMMDRPVATSWTSPIVIRYGDRDQLITCADPWAIAYDPADGTVLWQAKCMSGESGPSPVFAGGMAYVGNEYCKLSAVRVDGSGDVTDTHVAWTATLGLPDVCSPLATEEYVILLSYGDVTCYDAKDGTMLWQEYEAFDRATWTSSPSMVGGRLYLLGELNDQDKRDADNMPMKYCKSWVVEIDREGCKVVAEGRLDEGCVTSPAFQDGRIYIRGEQHLYCIGER